MKKGLWDRTTRFSLGDLINDSFRPHWESHGVGGTDAEIAFVQPDGVAYHARLVGGVWSAPMAIGGAGLTHVALAVWP